MLTDNELAIIGYNFVNDVQIFTHNHIIYYRTFFQQFADCFKSKCFTNFRYEKKYTDNNLNSFICAFKILMDLL